MIDASQHIEIRECATILTRNRHRRMVKWTALPSGGVQGWYSDGDCDDADILEDFEAQAIAVRYLALTSR